MEKAVKSSKVEVKKTRPAKGSQEMKDRMAEVRSKKKSYSSKNK